MRSFSVILLVFLVPLASAAASDAGALKQFGMLGRLAVDCAAPHSYENPHWTISVSPQGKIAYKIVQGRNRESRTMHNLSLLTPELLQYESDGTHGIHHVAIAKIDGKFRVWRLVGADGTIYVEDGKTTLITPQPHEPAHALTVLRTLTGIRRGIPENETLSSTETARIDGACWPRHSSAASRH
jgi:hypothetical protein